jgi:cysteine-rich repeat protein
VRFSTPPDHLVTDTYYLFLMHPFGSSIGSKIYYDDISLAEPADACDDGNTTGGDGCSAECLPEP